MIDAGLVPGVAFELLPIGRVFEDAVPEDERRSRVEVGNRGQLVEGVGAIRMIDNVLGIAGEAVFCVVAVLTVTRSPASVTTLPS